MSQKISPNLVYDLIDRFGDIYNCYENLKKENCNLELLLNVKESLGKDDKILKNLNIKYHIYFIKEIMTYLIEKF